MNDHIHGLRGRPCVLSAPLLVALMGSTAAANGIHFDCLMEGDPKGFNTPPGVGANWEAGCVCLTNGSTGAQACTDTDHVLKDRGLASVEVPWSKLHAVSTGASAVIVDIYEGACAGPSVFLASCDESLTGPLGPTGPIGPAGPAGPVGLVGPVGFMGPVGAVGPLGPAGPDGLPGAEGLRGGRGVQGPTGPTGPTGDQGGVGPDGPAGPSTLASCVSRACTPHSACPNSASLHTTCSSCTITANPCPSGCASLGNGTCNCPPKQRGCTTTENTPPTDP
jgi:collagen triple helix repeat protein